MFPDVKDHLPRSSQYFLLKLAEQDQHESNTNGNDSLSQEVLEAFAQEMSLAGGLVSLSNCVLSFCLISLVSILLAHVRATTAMQDTVHLN